MESSDATSIGQQVEADRRLDAGERKARVGDLLARRFLLREVLGIGSTGSVFAALDTAVGRKVAIKVLHDDLHDVRTRERLRREVRAARSGHPNVINVHDLHDVDGQLFLSMELVEGRSLKTVLSERGQLDPDEVVSIGRHISAALRHLHDQGIVHRDVKPGNILLTTTGGAKLCDMGLARPVEQGITVTETDVVVGTPAFMAPEQGFGSELTSATDIYGLGLTLHQCLTGVVPLVSETAVATLTRRQKERPASVRRARPDCPRWLARLVRRMLEPPPRERPPADAVLRALESGTLRPRPRRKTLLVSAAASCTAGALLGALILGSRPATVRFDIDAESITGRDSQGAVTWRRELEIPVAYSTRADLDNDASDEIILVQHEADSSNSRASNEPGPLITVLDASGAEWIRFSPEESLKWEFPYDIELTSSVSVFDIDRDGTREVVITSWHRNYYPSVLHIYWPRRRAVDLVLEHPGHIYDLVPTPASAAPGLRFLAINNVAGMTGFIGEIRIRSSRESSTGSLNAKVLTRPGVNAYNDRYYWSAYAPIGEAFTTADIGTARISNSSDGGLEVRIDDRIAARFSRHWNPDPKDPRDLAGLRLGFIRTLQSVEPGAQPESAEGVMAFRQAVENRFGEVVVEVPYRYIFDIASARAFARAGAVDAAISTLEGTRQVIDNGEILFRLANFEAISGNLDDAARMARELSMFPYLGPRSGFDAPHLLLRLGIRLRDRGTVDEAIAALNRESQTKVKVGVRSALEALARLWWDESKIEDEAVRSWAYAPAGEATACLARWRRGSTSSSDPAAMREGAQRNPDAAAQFLLASAAALIATDDARAGFDVLNDVISNLTASARENFADQQDLDLARALRTVALEEIGETRRAVADAQALTDELDPELLPGRLVREVLRTSHE